MSEKYDSEVLLIQRIKEWGAWYDEHQEECASFDFFVYKNFGDTSEDVTDKYINLSRVMDKMFNIPKALSMDGSQTELKQNQVYSDRVNVEAHQPVTPSVHDADSLLIECDAYEVIPSVDENKSLLLVHNPRSKTIKQKVREMLNNGN